MGKREFAEVEMQAAKASREIQITDGGDAVYSHHLAALEDS